MVSPAALAASMLSIIRALVASSIQRSGESSGSAAAWSKDTVGVPGIRTLPIENTWLAMPTPAAASN